MGEFYKTTKRTKILKLLKKLNFRLEECAKHTKATDAKTGQWTTVPRHDEIKSGTTESIMDFLEEIGYPKAEIRKYLN